ncbi:hypothetical protein V2J09_014644 [Rumex salicifolius]
MVERRNRVIVEKGLTLLAQSSLPHLFWEHAFKTATYLHNRTITHILDYHSPYHKLYNKSPDYGFLKTFGCLCYPFLRPYNHHKIDFRSLPCIFIGYSASHKGYLCFHKSTKRIYISRYVVFNENVFPSAPSPNLTPQTDSSNFSSISSGLLEQAAAVNPLPPSVGPLPAPSNTSASPLPSPILPLPQSTPQPTSFLRPNSSSPHFLIQRFISTLNKAFALKDLDF